MRCAVLSAPTSWYLKDLRRAAGADHEIVALPFTRLTASLGSEFGIASLACDLTTLDAVLVRTMPPGSLEQVIFRMNALAMLERGGVLVLNGSRGIETAVDKYLCSARLQQAGLLTPRTVVCQTADEGMTAFQSLGGDIVLKPLFGAEGRGIARLTDENLAWRAFKLLERLGAVLYLQEFVPHDGADLRLFVLGERVLGMRRRNPLDWRTNLSRGGLGEPWEVTPELAKLALTAARAAGTEIAGVDLLPARDGRLYALEVNGVPGWRGLARTLQLDIGRLVLDYVAERVKKA